jgi:hypothetical protein
MSALRLAAPDMVVWRWAMGRLTRRWPAPTAFTPHHPPYLAEPPQASTPHDPAYAELASDKPPGRLVLPLAGRRADITADEVGGLFAAELGRTVLQAVHAFAWLPLEPEIDDRWVSRIWGQWLDTYADADTDNPAWAPAVAARRALNLLDFAARRGLPGPRQRTLANLAAHGSVIAEGLDYWGEAATDHRLATEGLALFRLGLALKQDGFAQAGATILIEEAKRLFGSSGLLREGSTHLHLLIARDYVDGWLAARRHHRAEAAALEAICRRLLAPIPLITLSGGLPLVGDLAPDSPPAFLSILTPGGSADQGWGGLLAPEARTAVVALVEQSRSFDLEAPRADGWLRQDVGPWSGLWHANPSGWSPIPGGAHQDIGGFELHYEGVPVFVDAGCGCSGDEGKIYRSAAAHNGLQLNGLDPYPANRPHYTEGFRRSLAGLPPLLQAEFDGVTLAFQGYTHAMGRNEVRRRWRFEGTGFTIDDMVNGTGRASLTRRLITPLEVTLEDGAALIAGPAFTFKVSAEVPAELRPGKIWTAWGESRPAQAILFGLRGKLPWRGQIRVELV